MALCGRDGCGGTLNEHRLGYNLTPKPALEQKCDRCGHVLLSVTEGGEEVHVWLIDLGQDESFAAFVQRTRNGQGGPLGGEFL